MEAIKVGDSVQTKENEQLALTLETVTVPATNARTNTVYTNTCTHRPHAAEESLLLERVLTAVVGLRM